jgi:hypothetical protein
MSEIQEVYTTLMEVDKLLADIELKIENITGTSKGGGTTDSPMVLGLHKQMRLVHTFLFLLQEATGDKNVDKAIQKFNQLAMTAMHAQMSIMAFAAASGPMGWAYAGATALFTAISAGNIMVGIGE